MTPRPYIDISKHLDSPQPYRQNQLDQAIFQDLAPSINQITTFPKDLREKLSKAIQYPTITPARQTTSKDDSTTKILFECASDGAKFEAVLMRHADGRNTVCVSTQIGCTMGCRFCATGRMGFTRNLTYREIVDQVLHVERDLKNATEKEENSQPQTNPAKKANPDKKSDKYVTNIVYMGMGEPFLNPQNLADSIAILTDPGQFNFGSRRITVSTIGFPTRMKEFFKEFPQINLAISLHSAIPEKRADLMPKAAKAASLKQLAKYVAWHIAETSRRVSLEYILISGVNDAEEDVTALEKFFAQIGHDARKLVHVNLIPFNDITQTEYKAPTRSEVSDFCAKLKAKNINTTIRVSMGQESGAACGMLAGETSKRGA